MAAAYAPQCCNDIFEESSSIPAVEQPEENIKEEESSDTELDVGEISVVSKDEDSGDENTELSESSNEDDVDENNGYNNRRTAAMSHLRRARR